MTIHRMVYEYPLADQGAIPSCIADAIGFNRRSVNSALRRLMDRGAVRRESAWVPMLCSRDGAEYTQTMCTHRYYAIPGCEAIVERRSGGPIPMRSKSERTMIERTAEEEKAAVEEALRRCTKPVMSVTLSREVGLTTSRTSTMLNLLQEERKAMSFRKSRAVYWVAA